MMASNHSGLVTLQLSKINLQRSGPSFRVLWKNVQRFYQQWRNMLTRSISLCQDLTGTLFQSYCTKETRVSLTGRSQIYKRTGMSLISQLQVRLQEYLQTFFCPKLHTMTLKHHLSNSCLWLHCDHLDFHLLNSHNSRLKQDIEG